MRRITRNPGKSSMHRKAGDHPDHGNCQLPNSSTDRTQNPAAAVDDHATEHFREYAATDLR